MSHDKMKEKLKKLKPTKLNITERGGMGGGYSGATYQQNPLSTGIMYLIGLKHLELTRLKVLLIIMRYKVRRCKNFFRQNTISSQ
jgi:hypothetical protein